MCLSEYVQDNDASFDVGAVLTEIEIWSDKAFENQMEDTSHFGHGPINCFQFAYMTLKRNAGIVPQF